MNTVNNNRFAKFIPTIIISILSLCISACATTGETNRPPSFVNLGQVTSPPHGLQVLCHGYAQVCETNDIAIAIGLNHPQTATGGYNNTRSPILTSPPTQGAMLIPSNLRTEQNDSFQPDQPLVFCLEHTHELMQTLSQVNQNINQKIQWRSDRDIYGFEEVWTLPLSFNQGTQGDCEDYALEKRAALLRAGFPSASLALAKVYSQATGMHAVLVVRTQQGDFVLDNTTPWVLPWNQTSYEWLTMQASSEMLDWRIVTS